jgi:thioredoxin-like negative regulator of GroEL
MIDLTDETFGASVMESDRPCIVLLHRAGCSSCRAVRAEIDLLERIYGGGVVTAQAEQKDAPGVHRIYARHGTPVTLVVADGVTLWQRRGGSVTAASIARLVDDLLEE